MDCIIDPPLHDDDDVKAAWTELGDVVMRDWIRERPGSRPWAWWAFDAPERRQRIDGKLHPFDNKQRTLAVARSDNSEFWRRAYALNWGRPAAFIPPYDNGTTAASYEEEWEYLVRLNLLRPEDSP
jgi:hypothetical protein